VPAVYELALSNDYVHEAEHAIYLVVALLVWSPLLGIDPLPHRPGPWVGLACMVACMAPMAAIAVWLADARAPVYGHYVSTVGAGALRDQRLAATIMWAGGLPAFAIPALSLVRAPARWRQNRAHAQRAPA
jgi:putative membrane protein